MASKLDVQDGLSRKLSIEVPVDQVQQAFSRVYQDIQKNVTIKGFRKGKAPLSQVKSMFNDRVEQDVLQELISDAYRKAIEEHSLDPVGQPHMHFGKVEEDKPFSFTAEFEIRPEIKIKKIDNLKVEKEKVTVQDADIERFLENLRTNRADLVPVFEDRPAQNGDTAVIDFFGTIDGAPLEGGAGQDFNLELGSQSFIPGFEDGVVGMTIGQKKTLNLQFPTDYQAAEIAGKSVNFDVTLNKLLKKSLPELTDEFAQKQGSFQTMKDLRDEIRRGMEDEEKLRVDADLKNNVLRSLVEQNPIEVPKTLLKKQKERLVMDMATRMRQQGMNESQFNEYRDKWEPDFEKTAREIVQSAFLVDYLADDLKLRADETEVEKALIEEAQKLGIDLKRVRDYYADPERYNNFAFKVTETKVVDHLLAKANVVEIEKPRDRK